MPRFIYGYYIVFFTLSLVFGFWGCETNNKTGGSDIRNTMDGKVTGLGGIFFKVENPETTRDWYKNQLGFVTNEYGSLFESANKNGKAVYMQWSPFSNNTRYFEPSSKDFMINFRVENLDSLHERFLVNGVKILDSIETYEYGKFLHILDSENNKIELWEPVDNVFTKLYSGNTTNNRWVTQIDIESENPESLRNWYTYNLGIYFDNNKSLLPFYIPGKENTPLNFNLNIESIGSGIFHDKEKQIIITYSYPSGDSIIKNFIKQSNTPNDAGLYRDKNGYPIKLEEVK